MQTCRFRFSDVIIAELKASKVKSPRVDDRELNRSILSHISKLSESFRSESQARPGTLHKMSILYGIHAKILSRSDVGCFDVFQHL